MTEKTALPQNPIEYRPIHRLLIDFAVPSIIANLANSLYNIIDQIFIGQGIGYLGNAATNVAFPITTICLAIGLLTGIGAASNFNLNIGRKDYQKARNTLGTAIGFILLSGISLGILVFFNASSLMTFFGATDKVHPLATDYVQIIAIGIPFFIISIGGANLVRADGSAKYSMASILIGTVINTILNPLFIFVFEWSIQGAALATVAGQIISGLFIFRYFARFNQVSFRYRDITIIPKELWSITKLGINSLVFQLSNTVVQITLNNTLNASGSQSIYGADIPIAAAGITIKVNTLFLAVVIGIVQGAQPIFGVNYGARQFNRVRQTFWLVMKTLGGFSFIIFLIFQIFARQIIGLFGNGDELYFEYATHYMRTFLFMIIVSGMQIGMSNYLAAIGLGFKSAIISLNKQIIGLLPLIVIFGKYYGVTMIPYAAPITDGLTFLLACYFIYRQFQRMPEGNQDILQSYESKSSIN